jgi:hypothetical protein
VNASADATSHGAIMKVVRCVAVLFCLTGWAAPVLADSCPYFGRVYGDAEPGD